MLFLHVPHRNHMKEQKAKIAYHLKQLRTKYNYTQAFIADELGKGDYTGYQRLEAGKADLKLEDAAKLAEVYKISIDEIFDPLNGKKSQFPINEAFYGNPSILNMTITLDGREDTLKKQIELLTKINALLA